MSLGAKQIRAATMWLGHLAGTGRRRPSPLASPSSESSEDEAVGRSQPPLMRNPTKSLWKRLSAGSGAPPSPAASAASTAATAMTPSGASSTASSAEVHLENLEMTEDCQCPWPAEDPEEVHVLWERALAGRHVTELSTAELRALVLGRGGAPHDQRLDLWSSLFANTAEDGAETAMTNDSAVPEAARRQIDLDVPRTRPEWLGEEEREALRSVLHDFVAANPDVGYCQGLNNVAAVFVRLGFGRAASLRGLETLTREVCPGYHGPRLAGWLRDARVLDRLVRRLLPGAVDKLDALGVPLEVLAADHFLTLGSRSWPLTATAQLWDLLFLEGQPALFASFLALLDLYLPVGSLSRSSLCPQGVPWKFTSRIAALVNGLRRGRSSNLSRSSAAPRSAASRWTLARSSRGWQRRLVSDRDAEISELTQRVAAFSKGATAAEADLQRTIKERTQDLLATKATLDDKLRQLDETKRQLTIAVDNSAKQQDQIVQLEERLREARQDLDVLGPRVTVLEHEVRAGVARENALARTITDLESSVDALQRRTEQLVASSKQALEQMKRGYDAQGAARQQDLAVLRAHLESSQLQASTLLQRLGAMEAAVETYRAAAQDAEKKAEEFKKLTQTLLERLDEAVHPPPPRPRRAGPA